MGEEPSGLYHSVYDFSGPVNEATDCSGISKSRLLQQRGLDRNKIWEIATRVKHRGLQRSGRTPAEIIGNDEKGSPRNAEPT